MAGGHLCCSLRAGLCNQAYVLFCLEDYWSFFHRSLWSEYAWGECTVPGESCVSHMWISMFGCLCVHPVCCIVLQQQQKQPLHQFIIYFPHTSGLWVWADCSGAGYWSVFCSGRRFIFVLNYPLKVTCWTRAAGGNGWCWSGSVGFLPHAGSREGCRRPWMLNPGEDVLHVWVCGVVRFLFVYVGLESQIICKETVVQKCCFTV